MFKRLFKRKQEPTRIQTLYAEMREALIEYTNANIHYNQIVKQSMDSASPEVLLIAQELEVYRHRYYTLRLQYEIEYGNLQLYEEKLQHFFLWRQEAKLQCLIQKPYDHVTRELALEKVQ